MDVLAKAMHDVVLANRILAREGVVDAYGHVSLRHPENSDRYLMSRSRSPELVTLEDIMVFRLDGEPIDDLGRQPYAERHIHGAIYEKRPEIMSAVHNHSHEVIPFTVTAVQLRPVVHVGAAIGAEVPVWDIRKKFGDTNMLVVNMEQGRDLANTLSGNQVVLMRGHGCAVVGRSIHESVMISIYLQANAKLQSNAMAIGDPIYLSPGEINQCHEIFMSEFSVTRAWEYFQSRANFAVV